MIPNFLFTVYINRQKLGIYRDKPMADKLMYLANDDTQ